MSLLRALGWFVVSYGLAVIGYAATNAVAGRWFGRERYGYFVVALTASAAIGQLGLLGTHRGGLREAARLGSDQQDSSRLAILRQDARVASRLSLPLIALVSACATYGLIDGRQAGRLATAAGFGLLVVLSGMQKLWANYLRGLGHVRFASLLEGRSGGALASASQAIALGIMWIFFPWTGLPGAIAALAIGYAIPVLIAGLRASRHWAGLSLPHAPWRSAVPDTWSRNWRFAANQLAVYLSGAVDIWIAGVLLTDEGASDFSAAQRMALLLAIPLTSVQVVFAPAAARMLVKGSTHQLERVLRTGATMAVMATSVLWVPMLLAPGPVLALMFGSEFRSAATALMLLTLGNVTNVLVGLCGTALTMSKFEGAVAAIQTSSVALRLVVGSLAAYQYGVLGLAATSAAITVATYAVLWWRTHQLLGLWTHLTLRPSLGLLRQTSS